jgi:hypothetical protein
MAEDRTRTIIEAMMPSFRKTRAATSDYLQSQARRMGHAGAFRDASRATAPFAAEAGEAARKAAVEGTRLQQQQEQFETQQEAWERSFRETQEQNQRTNLLNQFKTTGIWTPEMLEVFGYDISKGQQRDIQKQLDILGVGTAGAATGPFGSRNPMLFKRALQSPGFASNTAQRRQQAWLRSQFG